VRLRAGENSRIQKFEIKKDPRLRTTQEEFKEQFEFLIKVRDKVSTLHTAVNTIRDIRNQTNDLVKRLEKNSMKDTVAAVAKKLNDQLKKVEEEIIQVKIKAGQDALNYPIKLNDKIATLSGVVSSADTKPTKQSYDVFDELSGKLDAQLSKYRKIVETDLPGFNKLVQNLNIPAVILKPVDTK
jgi:phenylalanyl-tRNA synthetase alpha subunit